MKAIVFTSLLMLISPPVQAMSRASAADLDEAHQEAMAELKGLNKDFHIAIRERVANETDALGASSLENNSTLLAGSAEVETLPGAEVTEPWILAAPETVFDRGDREDVGSFETAQLIPVDRTSDGGAALRAQ